MCLAKLFKFSIQFQYWIRLNLDSNELTLMWQLYNVAWAQSLALTVESMVALMYTESAYSFIF